MAENSKTIVCVRFSKVGKVYHFDATALQDVTQGDQVVVETSRGWQIGEVVRVLTNLESLPMVQSKKWNARLLLVTCFKSKIGYKRKRKFLNTAGTKQPILFTLQFRIIYDEISFDGNRATIYYSSETEEKSDFKNVRIAI